LFRTELKHRYQGALVAVSKPDISRSMILDWKAGLRSVMSQDYGSDVGRKRDEEARWAQELVGSSISITARAPISPAQTMVA